MIIVDVNKSGNIENSLKILKNKFIKTKTIKELNERKTFTKKSVKRRDEIKKARYIQSLKNNANSSN